MVAKKASMAEKRASTVTKIYKITLQEKLCNKYNYAAKNCDRQQSCTTPCGYNSNNESENSGDWRLCGMKDPGMSLLLV